MKKLYRLAVLLLFAISANISVAQTNCDTISNILPSNVLSIVKNPYGAGYIAGSNRYSDSAKSELFLNLPNGSNLSGAIFNFAHAKVANPSTMITVKAWNVTGTNSEPGTEIASANILLSTIKADITAGRKTYIPFSNSPVITDGKVHIGVILPRTTGDTLVLYTNSQSDNTGNGYEKSSTGEWVTYKLSWGFTLANDISPIICSATGIPFPLFSVDNTSPCETNTLQFKDKSLFNPTSWQWSFAGGTPSTANTKNVSVKYDTPGVYSVKLKVTNASGSDSLTKTSYITVNSCPWLICDTLGHLSFQDGDTNMIYKTPGGGYISGNNEFGDLAKAEKFTNGAPGLILNEAMFYFAKAKATNPNTQVTFSVWDATGPGGSPGNVIATQTVSLSSIVADVAGYRPTRVLFNSPPISLYYSDYFIGVNLPTTAGDSLTLFTSTTSKNASGGWEKRSNGSWNEYGSRWPNYAHFIFERLCGGLKPKGIFSASATSGCAPLTIQFTDLSLNVPTEWEWILPGATPSSSKLKNPVVVYNSPGTYPVLFFPENANGRDSIMLFNYITIGSGSPVVSLSKTNATCTTGGSITTTVTGATSVTYKWSNGDTTKNLTNIAPGLYQVTVTAGLCSTWDSITVGTSNTLTASAIVQTGPRCGQANGMAKVNPAGGTQPWKYNWSTTPAQASQYVFNIAAGNYTVTVTDKNNCTTVASVNVTDLGGTPPVATISGNNTVCPGGSVQLKGRIGYVNLWSMTSDTAYTQIVTPANTTTYSVTVIDANNCTGTTSKTITVASSTTTSAFSSVICQGKSYLFNGQSLTASGAYNDTIKTLYNCDSIITLNLTVTPAPLTSLSETICAGSLYLFNGKSLAATGIYSDTLQTTDGCDSIVTLSLIITPAPASNFSQSICAGKTYLFHGTVLSSSGTYTDTLQTTGGCDSIVTLNLTVNAPLTGSFTQAICAGSSYLFNGANLTTAGTYNDTLQTAGGCDSIVTLNLTVNAPLTGSFTQAICAGSSYLFNGATLTAPGTYNDTLQTAGGCDSIVTLNLTINAPLTGSFAQAICTGSSYLFNGANLTAAGAYNDTLQTAGGCDSIVTLNLTVTAPLTGSFTEAVCAGSSYLFNGVNISTPGTYNDTLQTAGGCDSIVTLTLTINAPLTGSFTQAICAGSSYLFNGANLTTAGAYLDTLQTAGGCDSIVTLNLAVNAPITNSVSQTICSGDSFVFKGQQLKTPGIYIDTLQAAGGCDSTVTLDLKVISIAPTILQRSICTGDSITIDGVTYKIGDSYSDTLSSANGCDSIVVLQLIQGTATAPPVITQNGNVLSTGLYNSYNWIYNNDTIAGAHGPSITATGNGIYAVVVTDSNGCYNISSFVNVIIGIGEVENGLLKFNLFPNPTESKLNIAIEQNSFGFRFTLTNLQGQEIESKTVTGNKHTLDVTNLAAGVYVVEVKSGNATSRKRFTKL